MWILIISLGPDSRHNIVFCLMGGSESENLSQAWYLQEMFASALKSVKAGPETPHFQTSPGFTLCSGPSFYLPSNWQTGKFIRKTCGVLPKASPLWWLCLAVTRNSKGGESQEGASEMFIWYTVWPSPCTFNNKKVSLSNQHFGFKGIHQTINSPSSKSS